MKVAVLLAALLSVTAALPAEHIDSRIIGGVNALPGEFPEICMIQWIFLTVSSNVCAGVVLNVNHLLTAGHCIAEAPTTGRLEAVCGIIDLNVVAPQQQRIGVLTTIIHPEFTNTPPVNDIAIVRLQAQLNWNDWIQPVTLPVAGSVPTGVTRTAGWGQTGTGILPPSATFLQKIQQPVVPFADCSASLTSFDITLHSSNICTGPLTGGLGICNGDAGGPVLQGDNTLIGIISYTTNPCAAVGGASIHTNVANFVTWINANS